MICENCGKELGTNLFTCVPCQIAYEDSLDKQKLYKQLLASRASELHLHTRSVSHLAQTGYRMCCRNAVAVAAGVMCNRHMGTINDELTTMYTFLDSVAECCDDVRRCVTAAVRYLHTLIKP